jgi:hypothetical protein
MAIGMIFEAKGVTQQKYNQVRDEVMPNGVMPKGLLYHVAGPSVGGWNVIEVWESEADARKFMQDKLGGALKRANISVQPKVFPVHAILTSSMSKAA